MEAIAAAARPLTAIPAVRGTAPVRGSEAPSSAAPARPAPVTDRYVPEEEHAPSGLYWIGRDEDGAPKVYFDDPEGRPAETCTMDTGKVDRELERLRSRKEELEAQLGTESDPIVARELEKKLARAEAELAQKDNDAYRRQNATIS